MRQTIGSLGKCSVWGVVLAASLWTAAARGDEGGWVSLFNGKDFTGWKRFLDPGTKTKPDQVWTIADGVISCTGRPAGYLLTEGEYENYELSFEWKWSGKPGNSGCFVHVVGEDKVWPKGVEAQLQSGRAGDFWLVDGFKLKIDDTRKDPNSDRHWYRHTDNVENPVGEWNNYQIFCDGQGVRLVINGKAVNEGTEPELTKGRILLQSEGAPIQFRNIKLRPLK